MASDGLTSAESVARFRSGCSRLGLELSSEQIRALDEFARILLDQNRVLNLTAITDLNEVFSRHFLDSLTVALVLQRDVDSALTVADVGSGGGIPGIVLAQMFPAWRLTLVESVRKKAAFIRRASEQLNLGNVTVRAERAEALADARDAHDVVVARAVSETRVVVEYCAPLTRPGGRIILYKSGKIDEELTRSARAMDRLACTLDEVMTVPEDLGLPRDRKLVVIRKTGTTPEGFPRRIGLARSRPL